MSLSLFPSNKHFYVISYDITENRSRYRVMKLLKGCGFHVQKSVFECILSEKQLTTLLKKLTRYVDEETDSIRVYRLCGECEKQAQVIGRGEVSEDPLVEVI